MKRIISMVVFLFPLTTFAQTARITIDTARVVGKIDPMIYGVFMEPIGREFGPDRRHLNTFYESLYNPGSPYANNDGFDTRYLDAVKELKITQMRWPGGNYTADYNWMNGMRIGPSPRIS